MARGRDPEVAFRQHSATYVLTAAGSDRALLVLQDVRSEMRVLIAPLTDVLSGTARWQPVADFPDEVTDVDLSGDSLYLLANRGHPRDAC